MNKQQKEAMVSELRDELESAQAIVLAHYERIPVPDIVKLRSDLREQGVTYKVFKNTLTKLAVQGTDKEFLGEWLTGPTALAWSSEDPVAAAKVLDKFAEDHDGLTIKAGYLTGKALDTDGVKALAKLPSKDELRAKFLSVLQGPAQKFVTLLGQGQRNFLLVLKARAEQLGEG